MVLVAWLLVLGLSLSHSASAFVLTAVLYAEGGRERIIIVSKQNKKRKGNLQGGGIIVLCWHRCTGCNDS